LIGVRLELHVEEDAIFWKVKGLRKGIASALAAWSGKFDEAGLNG